MKNIILIFICLFQLHYAIAKERSNPPGIEPATNIGSLLNPDGTLNLCTGFTGSLDLLGYQVKLDDCKGIIASPLIQPAVIVPSWSALGSGLNSWCHALTLDNSGNVYVGGNFTSAGGNTANRIAMWDGTSWSTFGSGLNSVCRAIGVDDSGNIYAGGDFTSAGGVAANYIAKWDGTTWSALGSGLGFASRTIAIDNSGNVFVGGDFTSAGGNTANRIAKWDGTNWSALGSGLSNRCYTIVIDDNDDLYAGGQFTTAGGNTAWRIGKWDGTDWSALGSGLGDTPSNSKFCYAITIDNSGNIYAGGNFTYASGTLVNKIAKWNGTAWSALGTGLNSNCHALASDNSGNVYAGGDFSTAGGNTADNIALWDGTAWSALGSGFNSYCAEISIDNTEKVFAAGNFTTAGGNAANRIAQWVEAPLPVELLDFRGTPTANGVQLSWATGSEFNNEGFQIEHSLEGNEWESLDFIRGNGSSSATNFYEYLHQNPSPGANYYRLKQIDYDGSFEYSNTISVLVDKENSIQVHPNPTTGIIKITGVEINNANLRIINNTGAMVKSQMLSQQDIDLSGLPSGLYFLSIWNANLSVEMKIIKE